MPIRLEGLCRCGAVRFALASHTPYPYQLCYSSICRKTAGGGGYAINIMGVAATLKVTGRAAVRVYHATIEERGADGLCRLETSPAERHFCANCASALWVFDRRWPELVHPFAAAINTDLPPPPSRVHLMLRYKAGWVVPAIGPDDRCFDEYPEQSIEDWHRARDLWLALASTPGGSGGSSRASRGRCSSQDVGSGRSNCSSMRCPSAQPPRIASTRSRAKSAKHGMRLTWAAVTPTGSAVSATGRAPPLSILGRNRKMPRDDRGPASAAVDPAQ